MAHGVCGKMFHGFESASYQIRITYNPICWEVIQNLAPWSWSLPSADLWCGPRDQPWLSRLWAVVSLSHCCTFVDQCSVLKGISGGGAASLSHRGEKGSTWRFPAAHPKSPAVASWDMCCLNSQLLGQITGCPLISSLRGPWPWRSGKMMGALAYREHFSRSILCFTHRRGISFHCLLCLLVSALSPREMGAAHVLCLLKSVLLFRELNAWCGMSQEGLSWC